VVELNTGMAVTVFAGHGLQRDATTEAIARLSNVLA
jgi:hypothetical protein